MGLTRALDVLHAKDQALEDEIALLSERLAHVEQALSLYHRRPEQCELVRTVDETTVESEGDETKARPQQNMKDAWHLPSLQSMDAERLNATSRQAYDEPTTDGVHWDIPMPSVSEDALQQKCHSDVGKKSSRNLEEVPTIARDASNATVHQFDLGHYEFVGSVWDAALFIGTDQLDKGGSIFMSFLLFLNITVQLSYTIIIYFGFTDSEFDDDAIQGFKRFRQQIAHDIRYMGSLDQSSLADRICSSDSAIDAGALQFDAIERINTYMPDEAFGSRTAFFGKFQGQTMCILAITMWCLVVGHELRKNLRIWLSFRKLLSDRGGSRSKVVTIADSSHILQFNRWRYLIVVFVIVVRLAVAFFLLIAGIWYMVITIDVRDLVLNSIALQCVLDVDVMFYDAFAPMPVKIFVSSLEPIPLPAGGVFGWTWSGLDVHSMALFVIMTSLIVASIPAWLLPEVNNLQRAHDILCNGRINFVYAITTYPPYITWSNSVPVDTNRDMQNFHTGLVQEIIDAEGTHTNRSRTFSGPLNGGTWSLTSAQLWSVDVSGTKLNEKCVDMLEPSVSSSSFPGLHDAYITVASELTGVLVKTCLELLPFCDGDDWPGSMARMLCPVTCNCTSASFEQLLNVPSAGCPQTCSVGNSEYQVQLNIPCVDQNKTFLQQLTNWTILADSYLTQASKGLWPASVIFQVVAWRAVMLSDGCGVVGVMAATYKVDVCSENVNRPIPLQSLRTLCPVSCNCSSRPIWDQFNCPTTCSAASAFNAQLSR